jgi:hypothetical protein
MKHSLLSWKKSNFVTEDGVLFVVTDGGKFREGTPSFPGAGPWSDYAESIVGRTAAMETVARRLGMTLLENKDTRAQIT